MKICSYAELHSWVSCTKYNEDQLKAFASDQEEFSIIDILSLDMPIEDMMWLASHYLTKSEMNKICADVLEGIALDIDIVNPEVNISTYLNMIKNDAPENEIHDYQHKVYNRLSNVSQEDICTIKQILHNPTSLAIQNEFFDDYLFMLVQTGALQCYEGDLSE